MPVFGVGDFFLRVFIIENKITTCLSHWAKASLYATGPVRRDFHELSFRPIE
jgi:hypothetical protein